MNNIYFLRIANNNSGLCNQIYSLISTIFHCMENNKNTIIISNFLKSIDTNNYSPISEIIDLDKLNNFLKKYNITLIDREKYEVVNEEYFTNPCNFEIIDKYRPLFKDILQELKFSEIFNEKIFDIICKINMSSIINVIHLRVEDDAIKHWSVMNNIDYFQFKKILIEKYKKEIDKNINKNDLTFILTSDPDNEVIHFLTLNNFNFQMTKKYFLERELNGIIDLNIGKLCNNVYIGPGNSTFTQCIINCINNKKNILFDLDHINNNSSISILNNNYNNKLPVDFNANIYKMLNNDLKNMTDKDAISHYQNYGLYENRDYKLSYDFDPKIYKSLHKDLENMNDNEATLHYLKYGKIENRKYL